MINGFKTLLCHYWRVCDTSNAIKLLSFFWMIGSHEVPSYWIVKYMHRLTDYYVVR